MTNQPVTLEQLARLHEAARLANSAYDAARRQYKRQQKAENRAQHRTQMIKFYMDKQTDEAAQADAK
jgi:hypothetical protein